MSIREPGGSSTGGVVTVAVFLAMDPGGFTTCGVCSDSFGAGNVIGAVLEVIKKEAMDSCVPERFIAFVADICFAIADGVNAFVTED